MADPNLVKYVRDTLAARFDAGQIEKTLSERGWPAEQVKEALVEAAFPEKTAAVLAVPAPEIAGQAAGVAGAAAAKSGGISAVLKSKYFNLVWITVFGLALLAAGAYTAYPYFFPAPETVVKSAIAKLAEIGSFRYGLTINLNVQMTEEGKARNRDSARLSDLAALKSAIGMYIAGVENPGFDKICQAGKIYSSEQGTTAADGTGWLPINFQKMPGGSPLEALPKDPKNVPPNVYRFACGAQKYDFEIDVDLESGYYRDMINAKDGGDNDQVYEVGTDLKLMSFFRLPVTVGSRNSGGSAGLSGNAGKDPFPASNAFLAAVLGLPIGSEAIGELSKAQEMKLKIFSNGTWDFREAGKLDGGGDIGIEFSAASTTFSAHAEMKKIGDTLYFRIKDIPALLDVPALDDQWMSYSRKQMDDFVKGTSLEKTLKNYEENLRAGFAEPGQPLLTAEQEKQIRELVGRTKFFDVRVKKWDETLDEGGVMIKTARYEVVFDEAGIKAFVGGLSRILKREDEYQKSLAGINKSIANLVKDHSVELWIGKKDGFIHKILVVGITGNTAVDYRGFYSVNLSLFDINQPAAVAAPQDFKTLKETVAIVVEKLTGASVDELFKRERDSARISDLSTLKAAVGIYLADVADPAAEWSKICQPGNIYASDRGTTTVDGIGWLPINFQKMPGGSPLSLLPADPTNIPPYIYWFACSAKNLTFEFDANLESDYYRNVNQLPAEDGGDNDEVYEAGTDLKIIH